MFGLVFVSIGTMGEYIGRIFDESKDRPNFIISDTINFERIDEKRGLYKL
jgi:dolichol-phosphate mannosyltransferase